MCDVQLLASVGMDDYHSLNVWDWRKGKILASSRGHSDRVSLLTTVQYSGLFSKGVYFTNFAK